MNNNFGIKNCFSYSVGNNPPNNGKGKGILGIIVERVLLPVIIGSVSFYAGYQLRKHIGVPCSSKETIDKLKNDFSPRSLVLNNHPVQQTFADILNEPFLLFDKFIHQREIVCIFSASGVGKTFLACHIAKNVQPKSTVYFALDDQGDNQSARINCISSINCISRSLFDQYLTELKESAIDICKQRAIYDKFLTNAAGIEDRRKKLCNELGVEDQQKVDELLLFELLLESPECRNANIIVLDSLNALLNSESKINRPTIERIIRDCRITSKTLIILHHTNKKNEIAGHSSLSQTVDLVLQLDKVQDNYRELKVLKSRFLQKSERTIVKMVSEGNHSVNFIEVSDEEYFKQYPAMTNLKVRILKLLEDRDTIIFEELFNLLKTNNETSVKNCLKKLEEKGYVEKTDGVTWKVIKNCMNSNKIS